MAVTYNNTCYPGIFSGLMASATPELKLFLIGKMLLSFIKMHYLQYLVDRL